MCKTFLLYLQMSCLSKQVSVSVLMIFVVSTLSCYLQFVIFMHFHQCDFLFQYFSVLTSQKR